MDKILKMTFGSVAVLILFFPWARLGSKMDCGHRNVAVIIDTPMHMSCTRNASDTVPEMWRHFPVEGTETEGVIISNAQGKMEDEYENFRVNNSSEGQLVLSTDSVRSTDAGFYRCSTTCEESGLVIVLDDEPECNLADNQPIQLRCFVRYYGLWPPSIKWNLKTDAGIHVVYNASNTTRTKDTVMSILNISSDPNLNATNFSCEIYFDMKSFNFQDSYATNVPEIHQVWSCPMVLIADSSSNSSRVDRHKSNQPYSWTRIAIYILIAFISLAVLIVLIFMKTKLGKYIAQQKIVQNGCSNCSLSCRNDVESQHSSLESKSRRSKSFHSDAGSLRSSVRVEPAYSQVHKCPADAASATRRKSFSASSTSSKGESSKSLNAKKALFVVDCSSQISNTVGMDGTIYQELNPNRPVPARKPIGQATKPRVNNDVYAAIDHTFVIVPPRHKF